MRCRSLFTLGLALAVPAVAAVPAPEARLPNVVIILADDLGYGDPGCYGSTTIATPRLDQLAREGVRFTDAYVAAPFCSPSRAALLTGRLPARCGVPYVLFPAERHGLPAAEITLAALLRSRGYATACIGKWHLGSPAAFQPQRRGFDEFFGLPYSNDSTEWAVGEAFTQVMGLQPLPLLDGGKVVEAPADQARLTERYTARAVEFIRRNQARPFFLYLPHTMPHTPQYASPRFAGRSGGGLYGDTVEEIDASTGLILDTLQELGLAERTLVIFASDNGAPARAAAAAPAKAKTPKKSPDNAATRFPGRNLSGGNGPLRAGKGTTFEGGVRVPFLVRWPGRIAPGSVNANPVSLLDVFPTCAAAAGAPLPADRTYDGRDLATVFAGAAETPRMIPHYFGYQPQAIREGRWKLFVAGERRPESRAASLWYEHQPQLFETHHRLRAAPELYDLGVDAAEARNVAAEHPDIVARLTRTLAEFDAALQRDCRPLERVPGPTPPAPQTVRTAATDLTGYRIP
jgi:arylsulfatase A-like enzyme